MKIIFKERIPNTNEVTVYNFKKTDNGININGMDINVLSLFKADSYMLMFTDTDRNLVYIDGKKLQEKGVDGFLELRFAFSKDYNQQIGCVWFGNTPEDITVIINIPVSFIDENFEFELNDKHNLEILKDTYPEAKNLFDSFNEKRDYIKNSLLF